jgi:putative sigma-54 modulation protein
MNLTISGHHLELTPSIREYAQSKLARVTKRFDQVIDIHAIFSVGPAVDKDKRHKAEINLRVKGKELHAESISQNLYAAIDAVIDKLDRQVIKYKERVQNHVATKLTHEEFNEIEAASA